MNKRKKIAERIESRTKKIEVMMPADTVAEEGTTGADVIASLKIDQKLAKEWINQPSMAGKKRAGTEGNVKLALRKISQLIGSTSWPKVKAVLKNSGMILDLYESTIEPINIHGFRFSGPPGDRREERKEDVLHYTTRDNQPKVIRVTSLRNTLSDIKKENNL